MKNCFSHLCCFTRQKESDTQLDDMAFGSDMRSEAQNGHRNAEHCRKSPSCVSFFSEDEKNHLALAARKAKDFDSNEEAQARTIFEGQLYKYTNVVKGYQYRFFVLNREMGTLEYYMLEDVKKTRPRGAMHLAGAVVSPSDEDGQMFTVSAACGEVYKLRAQDSKERQLWVNRMRFVAEAHTDSIGLKHPPIYPALPVASKEKENKPQPPGVLPCPGEAFQSLQQRLSEANLAFRDLAVAMETLPNTMQIKPHDPDLLLLKATSTATVVCLEQCFSLLSDQRYEQRLHNTPSHGRKHHSKKLKKKVRDWAHQPFRPVMQQSLSVSAGDYNAPVAPSASALPHVTSDSTLASMLTARSSGGEVPDEEAGEPSGLWETEVFPSDEDKDSVLTLMGQLKMGTDLTKVSLPVFVQEPRSLLEVYADMFSYAPLFVSIAEAKTEDERMLNVVRWLLSALFATRRGLVARKPFNPVLGESFRCSFKLPSSHEDNGNPPPRVTFVAEQVSHHPPKSAIYVECLERQMKCTATLGVKASFMNLYVGIEFIGGLSVQLLEYGESYIVTLPQMACRSLVSKPYLEFSGKMQVQCPKTGCSAVITFPSKLLIKTETETLPPPNPDPPFRGAKMHGVQVEIRNRDNNIALRGQGHWNESISFHREAGDYQQHFEFNIRAKEQCRKRVRLLSDQDANESRKVWAHVSRSLKQGDLEAASGYKFQLEESHRQANSGRKYEPKLFRLSSTTNGVNSALSEFEYKHALDSQT